MTTEIIPLLAECEEAGIRLSVADGKLVVEAPAGVVKPELLARLKQHKAALVAALSAGDVAPVAPSAEPAPAAAEPTGSVAAAPVGLPPGWPSDIPAPAWWSEFLSIKGNIKLLAARRQQCGDPACQFPVAVEWEAPGYHRQWACPRCGRATAPLADPPPTRPADNPEVRQPAVEIIEWRYPPTPRPGFRVKPRACGWCGPNTTWWQDNNNRWRCVRCDPPARQ